MSKILTVRLDDETQAMLTLLAAGTSRSQVVRDLIHDARHQALADEARAAGADPDDLAAMAAVAADMEAIRAW